eukprot:15466168-Alexandrium_andersonii.AAC.1
MMVMWNSVEIWIGAQPLHKTQRCSLRLPPRIDLDGPCHRARAAHRGVRAGARRHGRQGDGRPRGR